MNKLKQLRLEKNISQSALAALSGISVRCIQDYEQERRDLSVAEISRVYNLAKALNTRMEMLIEKDLL